MSDKIYAVMFLCTGNSARSIIAESVLNRLAQGRFNAYSAGSAPIGRVHPCALDLLRRQGYPVDQLSSKSWHEFAAPGAPEMDIVITVCDNAANESCPIWPGHPTSAHWGLPDPAAAIGSNAKTRRAFAETLDTLEKRVSALVDLPMPALDVTSLQTRLDAIGAMSSTNPAATRVRANPTA